MPISGPDLDAPADLADLLRRGLDSAPDAPALIAGDAQWTWRALHDASERLARHYVGIGLTPGDRIASLLPNRAELVVHYLACIRAGLVAMPLNYRYMPPEIDHALGVAEPTALLVHAERGADVADSQMAAHLPLGTITFGRPTQTGRHLETLLAEPALDTALPDLNLDAPAFVLFTSGSVGKPRGVTHSLNSLGAIVASIAQAMELTGEDVLLPGSSLSHVGSLKQVFAGLWVGARTVIARTFDTGELLALMRQTQPTAAFLLPAALFALVRDHRAQPDDFGSLRLVMSSGDVIAVELEREFEALAGMQIVGAYGMTEAGTSHANPSGSRNRLGSVGTNNPGYTSSLQDDAGLEVAIGAEGRHWIRSPGVMLGYWDDNETTRQVLRDGWFDTGDLMRTDADGYFWFCGRRKQIIVHDGSNINPQEVEAAIQAHPAVAVAGVVGVRNPMHGENVWAFVTLKDGAHRPSSDEIIGFARERIGYKAPEAVVFLDALPLNATGKLDRAVLQKTAVDRLSS